MQDNLFGLVGPTGATALRAPQWVENKMAVGTGEGLGVTQLGEGLQNPGILLGPFHSRLAGRGKFRAPVQEIVLG